MNLLSGELMRGAVGMILAATVRTTAGTGAGAGAGAAVIVAVVVAVVVVFVVASVTTFFEAAVAGGGAVAAAVAVAVAVAGEGAVHVGAEVVAFFDIVAVAVAPELSSNKGSCDACACLTFFFVTAMGDWHAPTFFVFGICGWRDM